MIQNQQLSILVPERKEENSSDRKEEKITEMWGGVAKRVTAAEQEDLVERISLNCYVS